ESGGLHSLTTAVPKPGAWSGRCTFVLRRSRILQIQDTSPELLNLVGRQCQKSCSLAPPNITQIWPRLAQLCREIGGLRRHTVRHALKTWGIAHTTAAMSCSHRGARKASCRPAK